ncbi:hypothetical protein DAPPUDRAFT_98050 [Daphnia pulex]|uniref:Janus kinase and microtubule-interacting protein C-terminal domain-containing protein n=1 Tax=Daphnia pulex TaxID=6669 RepID=E9G258_DAPPU|nr:hypothetical protein DAPPUDRAFT_98050 [Daphnia pulex]|eukprot:EFX86191.1 hypothetical protein DAPPUDRAFT_98050 [Daphnia pulex]
MEYVQQIQKLRKEQRYYSMWELPPLLEVDTDGLGSDGNADSDGSLSPAATSGVTSCSSDSAWSEDTRRELEVLFSQLSREHSDLQRNYQLLHEKLRQLTCFSDADAANVNYATLQADYNAARARIRDLEEILQLKNNREREASDGANAGRPTVVPSLLEIQAKFVREKHIQQTQMAILVKRLEEAKDRHQSVQAELNEARDQNELLEFRILELEEIQERAPSQCSTDQRDRKDVCTDTDSDDVSVGDSGITSLASLMVECPSPVLPRSPCSSGSSLDSDYLGEKISSVKAELQLMVSSLNDPSQKTVLAQLQALLGVCQSRLAHKSPIASETSNWDWQLQESGIFEEDHHHSTDGSTQTDAVECDGHNGDVSIRVTVPLPLCGRVTEDKEIQMSPAEMEDKSVQTAMTDVQDFAVQTDLIVCHSAGAEEKSYRDQGVQFYEERPMFAEEDSQTEGQVMTLEEFRDVESYYVQQIEILQKEKASHRKKFQASRDETTKSVQQLELLGRQFQERERQFEEILQKNCRAFERELETARELNNNELSTLKECLQLVWHEVKDYANVTDMPKTSVMEFTQALISSLHGICNELGQLRVRVVDLADMEQAFQTTLRQADGLVHHMEEKHLQRIRELEHVEHELRIQLNHPTGSHQSYDMDGSLEIKIQELEQEKDALSLQVGKCQELEDYCQRLHGRLEEYEQRERSLHQAVQDTERRFSTREQRYREEIQLMKTELDKCRENEATWRQRLEQRDSQLGLMRNELEAEQKTIASLELEVKELQSKLDKDDTSFRNEVTKLRSQLTTSLAQLNELESLNCQLREKIVEYQNTIYSLQRSLDEKSCQNGNLMAENNRLAQAQMEMMSMSMVAMAKPLTEELLEIESDEGCMSPEPVAATSETAATLDDFQEISLPTTPTVVDGCNNVFEEHFKVLESLESYLETQHLTGATAEDNDESGISTSPSIHENENFALLEAQLSQLRTEKHFLLNSVVNSQKKDEVIQILVDQLKYNAPRQYLIETAAHIRKIATNGDYDANQHRTHDKDIDRVCSMLEAPIDLTDVTTEGCSLISQQPSASPNCNYDVVIPHNKVVRRQTTVTVLPEEDPLLSPPSDLKITRKVGNDGLVIAWLPSPDSECVGYLICVNGQEAHRGRNAQRTKAVLSGLDLHSEMDISPQLLSTCPTSDWLLALIKDMPATRNRLSRPRPSSR